MNKCAIYIRVSTQEQAEEGYSLGEQEERLKKYCEAMGWNVVKVYNDGGYSGGSMERPALQQMIEDIKKDKTDIVLVDKLDRLSRSQFDTLYLIQKVFNANNVSFVSRAEAFDTSSPFGRAMVGILAVFAELERERIKERMNDGREGRAKEGKFRGGNCVSYGYDYNPELGYLVPNDYERLIVVEIFQMITNRLPFNSIADRLNKKGCKTKRGGAWNDSTIRQMARNKTYIGYLKNKDEWIPAKHEPIVPFELFQQVEGIMAERSIANERYKPNKKYTSPLGGLLYCGKCGAKYHYRKRHNNTTFYACYSRSKSDPKLVKDPNCQSRYYETQELEEIVYGEIRKLQSEPLYYNDIKRSIDPSEAIATITNKIKAVDSQMSKIMDLYSLGTIDINTIKSKTEELQNEKKSLELELSNYEKMKTSIKEEKVIYLSDLFNTVLATKDNNKIRSVIMDLIDFIELDDDEMTIHWNF